jgi:putative transposase
MARKRRIEFPGAFYHVLARGNNRQKIFKDEEDYRVYIQRLKRYHERYKFILYAYVLMPNHIHLLIQTGIFPLSKVMQGLQQSYTYYFHRKYQTVGHLFQGRYKAILCERDAYLLELVRYIHLNPVRAGLVNNPDSYPWSSHLVYLGYLDQPYVENDLVLEMLSDDESEQSKIYWQFIADGIAKEHQDTFYDVIDQRLLGNPEFVSRVKQRVENKIQNKEEEKRNTIQNLLLVKNKTLPEILNIVSEITAVPPNSILGKSREQYTSDARCLFAYVSIRHAGIGNKSVAKFLKRDPSSITFMIHKTEDKINKDWVLYDSLGKITKVFKV